MGDGEFEHPVEEQPAARRPSSVEAEDKFVKVALQVRLAGRAPVGPEDPSLGQGGDAVHAGEERTDVLSPGGGRSLGMGLVDIAERVDALVPAPAVGHDGRSRLDAGRHEGIERVGGPIGEDRHATTAKTLGHFALDCHADQDLLALLATAAQSGLLAAEVRLIHLDDPGEAVSSGPDEHRAQAVQHIAQAVGYEPISSARWRLRAETPSFWEANNQHAASHTVSGVLRRSNNVPAVTAVWALQLAHL
jgi:hypothetical protein